MQICDKLLQLRKEKGYSQEQLANILHVSRQAVSKWEAGNAIPELEKLISLSDIYQITLDYLVRDDVDDMQKIQTNNNPDATDVMMQLDEIKQCIKKKDGYEYKSKKRIAGIPLVHIKFSKNGSALACGIVAIGNVSIGVISIGGVALGGICFGGVAFGAILALAAVAIGSISFGGVSIGVVAIGGVALGQYAVGAVAAASKIAIGTVASGTIAIGKVVDGTNTILSDTATSEQIKDIILKQYPHFNKIILNLILTFFSK
ncbi:MAG: helix-turn-helix domain-containing protein [Velocimicrobium sp.]